MKIFTTADKTEEKFLRKPAAEFDFSRCSKKEIGELIKIMRTAMKAADGVGLSANQLGVDAKVFVARAQNKFYAVFNPKITKTSKNEAELEEGCLSVPDIFGLVKRPAKITLEGLDKNGKKIKIKAWGLLAQVFQHEVEHLNGALFIDKATNVHKIEIQNAKRGKLT